MGGDVREVVDLVPIGLEVVELEGGGLSAELIGIEFAEDTVCFGKRPLERTVSR